MTDDRVRFTDDQAAWSKASCVKQNYWKDDAILKIVPKGRVCARLDIHPVGCPL